MQRALPIFSAAARLAGALSVSRNQNPWTCEQLSTDLRSFTDFHLLESALPFLVFV